MLLQSSSRILMTTNTQQQQVLTHKELKQFAAYLEELKANTINTGIPVT